MDTRRFRILLLGTTLGLGAIVGLAPTSDAQPAVPDPVLVTPTTPPTTFHPGPHGCAPVNCDNPGDLADPCSLHPESCTPDTQPPGDEPDDPGTDDPQVEDPTDPGGSGPAVNPDVVVVSTPRFTG